MDKVEIIINGTTVFGWSDGVDKLLESNVSDMALSLERLLPDEPLAVMELAGRTLNKLPTSKSGSMTRIATLRTFKKRAEKLLATSK